MTPREHIRALIRREPVHRCGFWIGHPPPETLAKLAKMLGTNELEAIQRQLKDDMRWITPH